MTSVETTPYRLPRLPRATAAARRAGAVARRIPLPLAIVVLAAVMLRIAIGLAWSPAVMNNPDVPPYIAMAGGELFSDPSRPAGYPIFLRAVHAISEDLDLMIALQHLIGVLTGLLLYAMVRRIGAPVWAAVVAAAAVLLSLDAVLLEHMVMAESVFTLLLTAALYAFVRALDPGRELVWRLTTQHAWILAAGAALGAATCVRAVGTLLIPIVLIWVAAALPGRVWPRLGRAGIAALGAGLFIVPYLIAHEAQTGHVGMNRTPGWGLYGRAAPFADCSHFTPPPGTAKLCESTPMEERPGADFYAWNPDSPAHVNFGYPPAGDEELGAFAREAILNQPRAYLTATASDTIRYFVPGFNDEQPGLGAYYDFFDIQRRDEALEGEVHGLVSAYFPSGSLEIDSTASAYLSDLQNLLRVHPLLMLQAAILAAFGIWFSRGRVRAALILLLGVALMLLIIPSATAAYNVRYAMPMGGAIVAAGAVGLWVILERLRGPRDGDSPATEPPAPA